MDRRHDLLVGRHSEIDSLWTWLRAGDRPLLLEGEVGVGKTRLVSAVAEAARREGWSARIGHCYQTPTPAPFLPVLQLLSLTDGQPPEDLFGLPLDVTQDDYDGGQGRTRFIAELVRRLLKVDDSAPALLVVEDIQWADASSLLFLNYLIDVAEAPRLLLTRGLGCSRSTMPLLDQLIRKTAQMQLGPLSPAEIGELAREICGVGMLAPPEADWLHDVTGGNPLFASEILVDLKRSGLLAQHSARQAAEMLGLPTQLSAIFDGGLELAGKGLREVLRIASGFQGPLDAEVLARAAGLRPSQVHTLLSEGVGLGLLRQTTEEGPQEFAFASPFLRLQLYERLDRAGKRRVHARIAAACVERETAEESHYVALHIALSGAGPALTAESSRKAAAHAERMFGFEQAARFWRLAGASSRQVGDKIEALFRQGLSHRASGDWSSAARALERAFGLASASDAETAATVAFELGEISRYRLDLAAAERWLSACVEVRSWPARKRVKALALLGSTRAAEGKEAEARDVLRNALEAAREHEAEAPYAYFWAAVGYASLGDVTEAYGAIQSGLVSARQSSDRYHAALLASLLVQADLAVLRPEDIPRALEDIASLPEPRDAASIAREMMARAQVLAYEGRWADLRALSEEWMSRVRLAGRFQVATAQVCWSEASLWLGEVAAAVEGFEDAVPLLGTLQPLAGLHLARAYLRAGLHASAKAQVDTYSEEALKAPRSIAARVLLGELACDLEERELGARVLEAIGSEPRPVAVGYVPFSVGRVRARLLALAGNWTAAFEGLDAAALELANGRAHWEQVIALLDQAQLRNARNRRGDPEKAISLQAQAMVILRDRQLPVAGLSARIDISEVPPGARFGLTSRELQILHLVGRGQTNLEIATALTISAHTIDRHLENIYSKMGVSGRTQAVYEAFKEGLLVWP